MDIHLKEVAVDIPPKEVAVDIPPGVAARIPSEGPAVDILLGTPREVEPIVRDNLHSL